ncbi:hypothetical protein, partial [Ornithinibacillus halophilus]|uniref:hypothetical protein n=1 Tax=Ornithinibacillus halophilus TaxID=930117 RepID=UPI001F1AED57
IRLVPNSAVFRTFKGTTIHPKHSMNPLSVIPTKTPYFRCDTVPRSVIHPFQPIILVLLLI